MTFNSLAVILSMLLLPAAYSVPTNKQQSIEDGNAVGMSRSSSNFDMTSEATQLQKQLSSLSIHRHLKELYINLTDPDQTLSSIEMEVSTIQSYKNQVKCMYYNYSKLT